MRPERFAPAFFSPLFTGVRGRGSMRTSWARSSRKFALLRISNYEFLYPKPSRMATWQMSHHLYLFILTRVS
jgi:hypothetical protein